MKFIVNSQVLKQQLQSISGVIGNNNTVPIVTCFLFHLEEKVLTIRATDLETTMVVKIDVEPPAGQEPSEVAVPSKMILDILKNLDDAPLTFISNDQNYAIELECISGKYELAGQNPDVFPSMPQQENTVKVTMPASVFVSAVGKTYFATGSDEMRPQMAGIYCEMSPECTTFVATDAHKLVRYRRYDAKADESTNFIFPKKPVSLIKKVLESYNDDVEITMEYNRTNIFFTYNNYYFICRLVDGKYPNYEAAIPKENPNKLTLDRGAFLNVLKRVSIFANQSTTPIRLSINADHIVVSAEDNELANKATESLPCQYEGEPMEIGFSANFLKDMMSNLETENVLLELSHPSRAGIIFPLYEENEDKNEDILMLVMPVMLANA